MKEFNTFGPTSPQKHYYIDRRDIKTQINEKIELGRYITLNAARQIGKTTILKEIVDKVQDSQEYFGIYLDFEVLAELEKERFYETLGHLLNSWCKEYEPTAPTPAPMRDQGDFVEWLRATSQELGKQGILIIDEFESVPADILMPILAQFRGMYINRLEPSSYSLKSLILIGVRTVASLLEGTQSPFNIADQFTIPYFTQQETKELLQQHTAATGQPFEPETIQAIFDQTQGQPFLVNRIAKILIEDILPKDTSACNDPTTRPITPRHFDYALTRLLNENNTHFYSITSKAIPHRSWLIPILLYNQAQTNFRDPVTAELLMYGVLRIIEGDDFTESAYIANPIYRKVLLLTFTPDLNDVYQPNGTVRHRYLIDGNLDFAGVLDSFKEFMTEHGVRLLKSAKSGRPREISGQYLLLSFLTAALNSIQGTATIESMSDAGEIDILAFFKGKRFIVETKIWYGPAKFEAGKTPLTDYLEAASLDEGYLIVFDDKLADNSLVAEQGERFETTHNGKTVQVYFVPVEVL